MAFPAYSSICPGPEASRVPDTWSVLEEFIRLSNLDCKTASSADRVKCDALGYGEKAATATFADVTFSEERQGSILRSTHSARLEQR